MAISPLERDVNIPLSEYVFSDGYWGDSEPAQIIDSVIAKGQLASLGTYFKRTVPRIREHKTSPLSTGEVVDFAKLRVETVLAFDFESLTLRQRSPIRKLGDLALHFLTPQDGDKPTQTQEHLDWKISCSAASLIDLCNKGTYGPLWPGEVEIVKKIPHRPSDLWTYHRVAWFGIIAAAKDGGQDLLSFCKVTRGQTDPNTKISRAYIPRHRPLVNGAVTHTSSDTGMRIERIRSIEAYPPIRMELTT